MNIQHLRHMFLKFTYRPKELRKDLKKKSVVVDGNSNPEVMPNKLHSVKVKTSYEVYENSIRSCIMV